MHLIGVKYWFKKLIVLILAFQILNMSVHSGAQSGTRAITGSIGAYNQIDCFMEYFYENICSLKGYDDIYDLDLHNKLPSGHKFAPKFVDIQMPILTVFENKTTFISSRQNHFPLWSNEYDYLFAQEITPPPPKSKKITIV